MYTYTIICMLYMRTYFLSGKTIITHSELPHYLDLFV